MMSTTGPADPPPERWEETMKTFEENDGEQAPPARPMLFTGSSTIVRWSTLSEDFPFAPVINRGFGGSQVSDLLAWADRVILPYQPRVAVVYSGDNDIAAEKTAERVVGDFVKLQAMIHEALPETETVIIGPKLGPKRWHLADVFRAVNDGLAEWADGISGVEVLDINEVMLGTDGLPRPELYCDGVHLTPEGYAAWTGFLAPRLQTIWARSIEAGR